MRRTRTWSVGPVPGNGDAIAALSCFTATHCVGVSAFSREVIVSDNAGLTWQVYQPEEVGRYGFTSLDCVANGTCFAIATLGAAPSVGAAIYRSTNGGRSWIRVYRRRTPGNANFRFNDVSCLSATYCLVSGTTGTTGFILVTNTAGRFFTPATLPPQPVGGSIAGLDCVDESSCFAVQNTTARVYASSDTGRLWRALPVPANFTSYERNSVTPTGLSAISCGSPLFCVAGGYIGHLNMTGTTQPFKWVTRDGGKSWSYTNPFASTGARTPNAVGQNAVSCTTREACTMGLSYGDVYSTSDGGLSWSWELGAPQTDNDVLSVACPRVTKCLVSAISNFPKAHVFAGMLWREP